MTDPTPDETVDLTLWDHRSDEYKRRVKEQAEVEEFYRRHHQIPPPTDSTPKETA